MARQKDNVEVQLAATVKRARTSIRLKHSLEADAEINEVVPKIEARFYALIQRGKSPQEAAEKIGLGDGL